MSQEQKECHCTPRLRFPEFRNSGEWPSRNLGDICNLYQPEVLNTENLISDGKYPVYGANGIIGRYTKYNHKDREVVVTCRGSTCGEVNITECKSFITSNAMVVSPNRKDVLKYFLFYVLLDHGLKNIITGSAQPQITVKNLCKLILKFPCEREQQKIADCLSSLDDLITAHEQKRDALTQHKKGLMQRLFPAEGETTPRWRFPEFREAGEWETNLLGKICKTFSGSTPTTTKKEYYGGHIPFIRSAEIASTETELYITDIGLSNSSAKIVHKGDILLALYGATSGEVAISKINGAINQAVLCIRSSQNNFFIYYFLFFKKNYITSKYLQGGQGNLSGDIIKSIEICYPTLQEQQKIADCLSALDERIAAEEAKIAALREHKKGLMQQLFPQ